MNQNSDIDRLTKRILTDQKVRQEVTSQSHQFFFSVYMAGYIYAASADMHRELFEISEDIDNKLAVIIAFRSSGKSTIFALSYALWAILGVQKRHFVLILSQTIPQARQNLMNIRKELESNGLLRKDMGPFKTEEGEWGSWSIVLPKYDARITSASCEQSIRGLRHRNTRPDIILCDDIENSDSVKTKEGRDRTWKWLTSEVFPVGQANTKIIVIGNLLHQDSLLMRLKGAIEKKKLNGIFKAYPIVDGRKILWPGLYPTMEDIETKRKQIGDEIAFRREFMLEIVPDEDQVIFPEWLHYYAKLPKNGGGIEYRFTASGVDLAIAQNDWSDYTSIVSASVYGYGKDMKIYIHPNPINRRMTFPETISTIKSLSRVITPDGSDSIIYVENVAYQASLAQELNHKGFTAELANIGGKDKRSRLSMTTYAIKSGQILFPMQGCDQLINQLLGFGTEKFDDLCDAFSIVILEVLKRRREECEIVIAKSSGMWDRGERVGNICTNDDWDD